jgi:transposase-like protein
MEKERKRRKFSDQYKAETVRLIQRSGKSIGQALKMKPHSPWE